MDRQTIAQLARLSRLELDEHEVERARGQLEQLLAHFDALQELDTDDVASSPYPWPMRLRLRPDEPGETLDPDEVLRNAPATRAGQFLVPKVIEG